jgi:hypothetical protein
MPALRLVVFLAFCTRDPRPTKVPGFQAGLIIVRAAIEESRIVGPHRTRDIPDLPGMRYPGLKAIIHCPKLLDELA